MKVDLKKGCISYWDGLLRNRIFHACHSIIRGKESSFLFLWSIPIFYVLESKDSLLHLLTHSLIHIILSSSIKHHLVFLYNFGKTIKNIILLFLIFLKLKKIMINNLIVKFSLSWRSLNWVSLKKSSNQFAFTLLIQIIF